MVVAAPDRLNSTTATDPSDMGLAQTCRPPPRSRISLPCEPAQSWSTAMTSAFLMIASAAGDILVRSLPNSSGEFISDHSEKCERYSSAVSPWLPTSNMSMSFRLLGPENTSRPIARR